MDNNQIEATAAELKELYRAKETIEAKIRSKEQMIKDEMAGRSVSELKVGIYKIKYTQFTQERFDSKAFRELNENLYNQYKKTVNTSKFTIDD